MTDLNEPSEWMLAISCAGRIELLLRIERRERFRSEREKADESLIGVRISDAIVKGLAIHDEGITYVNSLGQELYRLESSSGLSSSSFPASATAVESVSTR